MDTTTQAAQATRAGGTATEVAAVQGQRVHFGALIHEPLFCNGQSAVFAPKSPNAAEVSCKRCIKKLAQMGVEAGR